MLTPQASLIDVMFAVCSALDRVGERDVANARKADISYDLIADWMQRELDASPAAYDPVRRDLALKDLCTALEIEK